MGFFSFCSGAISGAISSICSSISSAIGSAIGSIATTIGNIIGQIPDALKAIADVASNVLKAFGIIKPDEQIEEMGERALQLGEQGIKPEDYPGNFSAYMEKVRNLDLDPEKAAKRDKTEQTIAGISVGTHGLGEKLDTPAGKLAAIWMLPALSPGYFSPDKLTALLQTPGNIDRIFSYLDKGLDMAESRNMEKTMIDIDKAHNTESTPADTYKALDEAMEKFTKLDTGDRT